LHMIYIVVVDMGNGLGRARTRACTPQHCCRKLLTRHTVDPEVADEALGDGGRVTQKYVILHQLPNYQS
jgi:hypothetical protein